MVLDEETNEAVHGVAVNPFPVDAVRPRVAVEIDPAVSAVENPHKRPCPNDGDPVAVEIPPCRVA